MKDLIDLEGIANGDSKILTRIYAEYQRDFHSWSRKSFHIQSEEVQEIFQDSVVTLYENVINHKLVNLNCSIKTYLFAIGKNKTLEFLRKSGRSVPMMHDEEFPLELPDEPQESESETMRKHKLMKECIDKLGTTCQTILTLFYFHQMNLTQIKEKLAYKNEESVKSQKFKCMERLRADFKKQYQGSL